jgi:inorganic triphosphatase YgiF
MRSKTSQLHRHRRQSVTLADALPRTGGEESRFAPSKRPESREIELKLELAAADCERLVRSEPWLQQSDPQFERLSSVYFDTPDCRLLDAGCSLRVRSVGARSVQTLKSLDRNAGLFDRAEWEEEVDGPWPDLSQLRKAGLRDLKIKSVKPVVRTEIERRKYQVAQSGAELEIDIDLGTVSAGSRERRVSELEIELIRGSPAAAVQIARRIADDVPVKLAVMSKAERGFSLAKGKTSPWRKAEPVQLRRGMSVAKGFEIIVASCLRHFRLNEPFLAARKNVEALHQTRVAIRRLLSALAVFRPIVGDLQFDRIRDEFRWFIAESGEARNLDVYLQRDLSADQRQFVGERRIDAYARTIKAIDSARFRRLMLDVLAWSLMGQWRGNPRAGKPLEQFVNRRVDSLWSKIACADRVATMGDRKRHHVRIQVKKLRYALEFADGLHRCRPKRKKAFEKALEELQESLGSLHDIATARSLIALNSWLQTSEPTGKIKRRQLRKADRAVRRLRKTGTYW